MAHRPRNTVSLMMAMMVTVFGMSCHSTAAPVSDASVVMRAMGPELPRDVGPVVSRMQFHTTRGVSGARGVKSFSTVRDAGSLSGVQHSSKMGDVSGVSWLKDSDTRRDASGGSDPEMLQHPMQHRQGYVFPTESVDHSAFLSSAHSQYMAQRQEFPSPTDPAASSVDREGSSYSSILSSVTGGGGGDGGGAYPAAQNAYTPPPGSGSIGGLFEGLGLGNYGAGAAILPALLVTGLLFLVPSVVDIDNSSSQRRRRQAETWDDGDAMLSLLKRMRKVYGKVTTDGNCSNKLFCHIAASIARTGYNTRILKYINYFYHKPSDQLKTLQKAAVSSDPDCEKTICHN